MTMLSYAKRSLHNSKEMSELRLNIGKKHKVHKSSVLQHSFGYILFKTKAKTKKSGEKTKKILVSEKKVNH